MIDLTKGLAIASEDIVIALGAEPPSFMNDRDNKVEFTYGFPNMMYTLWGYICTYRRFPTQSAFVAYYHLVHEEALKGYDKTAVSARLLRSYPS